MILLYSLIFDVGIMIKFSKSLHNHNRHINKFIILLLLPLFRFYFYHLIKNNHWSLMLAFSSVFFISYSADSSPTSSHWSSTLGQCLTRPILMIMHFHIWSESRRKPRSDEPGTFPFRSDALSYWFTLPEYLFLFPRGPSWIIRSTRTRNFLKK